MLAKWANVSSFVGLYRFVEDFLGKELPAFAGTGRHSRGKRESTSAKSPDSRFLGNDGPGAWPSTGTAMPLTAARAEVHRLLASAGLGGADNAALMKYFDGPGMEGVPT